MSINKFQGIYQIIGKIYIVLLKLLSKVRFKDLNHSLIDKRSFYYPKEKLDYELKVEMDKCRYRTFFFWWPRLNKTKLKKPNLKPLRSIII